MSQRLHNISHKIFSALWLSLFVSVGLAQVTTAPNQEKTQTLPTFSAQERDLKGGETHSYRLPLIAGQFFYAVVEQKEIDVSVALFAPDGKEIGEADSPNDRWGTEPVLLVAEKAGDYRIEVRSPNSKVAPGRYAISIVQLREATADDKTFTHAQRLYEEAERSGNEEKADSKRASIDKYLESANLFAARGETYRQALTLRAMIDRFAQLGDYRNLLKYAKEGLSLAQSMSDRRLEGAQAAVALLLGNEHAVEDGVVGCHQHHTRDHEQHTGAGPQEHSHSQKTDEGRNPAAHPVPFDKHRHAQPPEGASS